MELEEKNKRLEQENMSLRNKLLSKLLSDNIEVTRLEFKIKELEKEVLNLKQKNAYLTLLH